MHPPTIWRRVIDPTHRRCRPIRLDHVHHPLAVWTLEVVAQFRQRIQPAHRDRARLDEALDRSILCKLAVGARNIDDEEDVVAFAQ